MLYGGAFENQGLLELAQSRQSEIRDQVAELERAEPLVEEARRVRHQRHLATMRHLLTQAERAVGKGQEGTYGQCDGCDQPIPQAILRQDPTQTLCSDCGGLKQP